MTRASPAPAATTVFPARKILTMNPAQPQASCVAVRDGRILAVGSAEEVAGWGAHETDSRFAGKVLMPGLVEGHSHLMEGGFWKYAYVGYHDRRGPDGRLWKGLRSFDAVVERLSEFERGMRDPAEPLLAWGFDPIYFGATRMTTRELDRVSGTRPIAVLHASIHLLNVNTAMLRRAGIEAHTQVEGIARYPDGSPSGELQEFAAMFPVMRAIGNAFARGGMTEDGLWRFGRIAALAGVTTATDMLSDWRQESVENLARVTAHEDFPVRIVSAYRDLDAPSETENGLRRLEELRPASTDKLRFSLVKLVVDGSIQGFTARLRWPGYYNGRPNGIWIVAPAALAAAVERFHAAGAQLHIHTNGDEATEVALDALEGALARHPRPDHRHTLQHCQMADAAQFRRMARLGVCVNLFANHIYYWGDVHYAQTMGPDRANRMDACGSAQRFGVPFAIHSDAPITPLGPLFTAWCAVNRLTASGRVLGSGERIEVPQALSAITLGAAYTLTMDHEIGSIEVGKRADFCVLEDDPLALAPQRLKDARVWGTVLAGKVFEAPHA
ncbi:MAG TPA: amidohydrolase [Usitatibacter sp.]|nr:amidohydrolase [Usitatibacter sp.]